VNVGRDAREVLDGKIIQRYGAILDLDEMNATTESL
jgi:hypothetical protein